MIHEGHFGEHLISEPSNCPICGAIAHTAQEEIDHMTTKHPEVIEQRMTEGGFFRHPQTGEWIDGWATDA